MPSNKFLCPECGKPLINRALSGIKYCANSGCINYQEIPIGTGIKHPTYKLSEAMDKGWDDLMAL